MGKLTIQEIAAILIQKNGLQKRDANQFASAMFALIQERLETDQLVKVKGLGTFKIIDVEARESVSVRTGERVTIDGHAKVTFIPDATMKELVNKPFSQFETVVLNDGVEFDDIQEETPAASISAEPVEAAEPVEVAEPEAVEPVAVEPAVEPSIEPEEPAVEPEPEEPAAVESEPAVEPKSEARSGGRWIPGALGVLALMALSAYGGYYYGCRQSSALAVVPDTVTVHDTVSVAPIDSVESIPAAKNEPDTIPAKLEPASEAARVEPMVAPRKEESAAVQEKEAPAAVQKKEAPAQDAVDKYAQKDARVRLGAYRIVGLSHEVKVQPGQTFYSICRGNLGPDMECYVEVFNDLPKNPTIKVGQVIKIPKLQLKKKQSKQ